MDDSSEEANPPTPDEGAAYEDGAATLGARPRKKFVHFTSLDLSSSQMPFSGRTAECGNANGRILSEAG
jgi:hypothetical protein